MKAVLHGPLGSVILDTSPFTFGSSPDNSLVIDNIKAAAHHAVIRSEESSSSITDLGSIHGTYINGERLDFNSPRLLSPGDSITIGDSVFRYDVEETPQVEEDTLLASKGEEEQEVHSKENLAPSQGGNDDEDTIHETSEDQQFLGADSQDSLPQQYVPSYVQQSGATAFIPADYDGPIPGYIPIEQVRRRDRRFIFIGVGLLILIALAAGSYFYFNRSTPEKTLDAFCTAMQGQDYQSAYNQLSNLLQSTETELEFANTLRASGKIHTCTHSSVNTTNNKATANLTIVTTAGRASNSSITLTTDSSNNWKLSLFPSTPDMTLTAFCNALRNKDYPTAYAQLTSGIKRAHAEAQFETDFASVTCSYNNLSSSGSTRSATVTFTSSSGQTASAKVLLIQDGDSNNIWKINSIQS